MNIQCFSRLIKALLEVSKSFRESKQKKIHRNNKRFFVFISYKSSLFHANDAAFKEINSIFSLSVLNNFTLH
jgi:hypothetical protein